MKRIGDVMKHISIPMGPDLTTPVAARAGRRLPALPGRRVRPPQRPDRSIPDLARSCPCTCRVREEEAIGRRKLRELSNLGAFTQYEFDAFDSSCPRNERGLRRRDQLRAESAGLALPPWTVRRSGKPTSRSLSPVMR